MGKGEKLLISGGSHKQAHVRSLAASGQWRAAEILGNNPWRLLASVLKAKWSRAI